MPRYYKEIPKEFKDIFQYDPESGLVTRRMPYLEILNYPRKDCLSPSASLVHPDICLKNYPWCHSWGANTYSCIHCGMTTEQYRAAGGRGGLTNASP